MENSKKNRKEKWIILGLLLLLLLMFVVGILGGTVSVSLQEMLMAFGQPEASKAGRILFYVRLPRAVGAVVAGAALAVAGAIIQTILNNPLASPNIIGVNAGSGFAVILCGVLFPKLYYMLPVAAFLGAFLTVLFVYYLGRKAGFSKITLVLAGVAINSMLSGATDFIFTIRESSLISGNAFKIGGLQGIDTKVLAYASVAAGVTFLFVMLFHNELEVFSLGEEKAMTLGLPIGFYRFLFLALAAALAGAAVSFAGLLGFVGLMVPHVARKMVGGECKYFLAASALLGALLLSVCDYAARILFRPYELSVGILLSLLGAPFFLWLLCRKKEVRNGGK